MACLSAKVVLRNLRNASIATSGRSLRSVAETPFLVNIGLFVIGEMVVIVSKDILGVAEQFSLSGKGVCFLRRWDENENGQGPIGIMPR